MGGCALQIRAHITGLGICCGGSSSSDLNEVVWEILVTKIVTQGNLILQASEDMINADSYKEDIGST